MPLGQNHDLKWPNSPPGTHHNESIVLKDRALLLLHFDLDVVAQQVTPSVLAAVLGHLDKLSTGLLRHGGGGPDLAVRVRVRASHGRALVLKDLHKAQLVAGRRHSARGRRRGQLESGGDLGEGVRGGEVGGVDVRPDVDHGSDLFGRHVCEGNMVLLGEGEDVAFAGGSLSLEEGCGEVWHRQSS